MKNIINAVAAAVVQDQLTHQILGQEIRHRETVLDGKLTILIELRFQLLNIHTKEISLSPWQCAPIPSMEQISRNILDYIKSIPAEQRTIN